VVSDDEFSQRDDDERFKTCVVVLLL